MKKLSLIFLSFLLVSGSLNAQTKVDNRTTSTRIADILAQFPAQDAQQLATNMNEVGALGEAGLVDMAKMLVPPGKGDNSKIQYALGGFSYYVTQSNRENLRAMAANAYVKALDQVTDPVNKTFLIFQLQMVGKDEAVAALVKNLSNDQVCGPAARALVKINTASARSALLNALSQAQGTCQLSLVEALGDSRDAAAVPAISKLASSSDEKMKKVALFALANIGDPAAEPVLAAEAEKANYAYQNANATAAYLRWAETMLAAGNKAPVEKMAQTLLDKTTQDNQVPTRIAALNFLVDIQGEQSLPLLVKAANDKNQAYRVAALNRAAKFKTGTSEWLAALKKAKPDAKADIINLLGTRQDAAALPVLLKAVKNKNQKVKVAAITAAGKVGQEATLPAILKAMRKGDSTVVQAAQTAILTMKGTNIVPQVSEALPKMRETAQVALLQVLGSRKATEQMNVVLDLAKSKNPEVELAALTALKDMATQENLTSLYPLLLAADRPEEVTVMQEAIYNAVKSVKDNAQQTDIILQQMAQAPADKKSLYYAVLSKIGGKKALQTVVADFKSGNDGTKKAAFAALGNWTDFSAATELFNIAQSDPNSPYFNQALQGYVRQVSTAKFAPEQKLLLLTKVMDIAKTSDQKTAILREVGKSPTYLSLLLAGKY
ncbi:MAG: HEAT repeat domain-containing protein, partial [Bacteroidota bacterium]|nr:HEAT repeat domain-containing protein [Bacteroidota bacterium]